MGNLNEWICACEKDSSRNGQKCESCRSSILNDFSFHMCPTSWGDCQKKSGW